MDTITPTTYTVCANCNQVNRVPIDSPTGKAAVCGRCKKELLIHGGVSELNPSTLATLIQKSPLPIVVDFWAPWCQPCRVFAPVFLEAARKLVGKVVFTKVDTQANPAASDSFQIRGIPTLVLLQDGKEITRQSGAMPLNLFLDWLKKAAS
jgi:thioredoxin 2